MDLASLIVIFLRVLVPVSILRYPLFGIIACLLLDIGDVVLVEILGGASGLGGANYHQIDKILDIYYLSFASLISLRWTDVLARRASFALFWYRFLGISIFLMTDWRIVLVFFPNIFEFFFIFYLVARKISSSFQLRRISQLILILAILSFFKLGQEYIFHYLQMDPATILKTFTPIYFEESTIWGWISGNIF